MHYLDHAAATPMRRVAKDALMRALDENFANVSSSHSLGTKQAVVLEKCRQIFKRELNINDQHELLFTSCATESNNLLLQGLLQKGDVVWCDLADHPSILEPMRAKSAILKQIPMNENGIDYARWEVEWVAESSLVALSQLNGLTGREHDVHGLASWLRQKKSSLHLHLDLSQALGKMPVSFESGNLISTSWALCAHKMGGPKGIAALVGKPEKIRPMFFGGGQQQAIRPGTIPLELILAWTAALEEATTSLISSRQWIKTLGLELTESLEKLGMQRIDNQSGHWISLWYIGRFGNYPSDMIVRLLQDKNIFISSSTACNAKKSIPIPAYSALGIDVKNHRHILRISFAPSSVMEDVKQLTLELKRIQVELGSILNGASHVL